ncbi:unnamed protein product [Schistosoma margrebowiei]|uniref:Uncharacterized protein n=1 Tax=Schistosoma margrebowiei TaxID=48269 RepID=A0A183MFW1_9TREM|nr:unnamed protein product [Schistosoma margrebowiei]
MVVVGSQQKTLDPGFVLLGTRHLLFVDPAATKKENRHCFNSQLNYLRNREFKINSIKIDSTQSIVFI